MAFGSAFDLTLITTIPGSWTLEYALPEATESGWDTLRAKYWANLGFTATGASTAGDFPVGGVSVSGLNFRTVRSVPRCVGGGIWEMDVFGHGYTDLGKIKVRGGSRASTQTAENITHGGYGLIPRFTGLEATPTVTIEYVTTGLPATADVGLAGTPAVAPAVRASLWSSLTDPMQHFPFGWVMVGMDFDRLPNTTWHLVQEQWEYIFRYSP